MATINGTNGNDTLLGSSSDDIINGFAGADIITGGLGADTLTGGTGADIFRDTAAGLNGDTITDFLPGDRIQLTDLDLSTTTFGISGSLFTYTSGSVSGSITIDGIGPGRFVARAITGGGVEVRLQQDANNDFNGDGRSDILWRNDDGTVTNWIAQQDGTFSDNSANFQIQASSNWHIAATGDFNGDGLVDLMWRSDDGTVTDWLGQANGGFSNNFANFSINASPNWHIAATGDFNGDGIDDILWRSDDGTVTDWLGQPNGSFSNNFANFSINASSNWHIAGTGDFNGDGIADILWRSDDGTVTDWLGQANGGFSNNFANFNIHADSSWQIAAIGDFNSDGIDDLLWRSDTGQISDWFGQSNGAIAPDAHNFNGSLDTSWHVQPQETIF